MCVDGYAVTPTWTDCDHNGKIISKSIFKMISEFQNDRTRASEIEIANFFSEIPFVKNQSDQKKSGGGARSVTTACIVPVRVRPRINPIVFGKK